VRVPHLGKRKTDFYTGSIGPVKERRANPRRKRKTPRNTPESGMKKETVRSWKEEKEEPKKRVHRENGPRAGLRPIKRG